MYMYIRFPRLPYKKDLLGIRGRWKPPRLVASSGSRGPSTFQNPKSIINSVGCTVPYDSIELEVSWGKITHVLVWSIIQNLA
jgi:hypothetical protein